MKCTKNLEYADSSLQSNPGNSAEGEFLRFRSSTNIADDWRVFGGGSGTMYAVLCSKVLVVLAWRNASSRTRDHVWRGESDEVFLSTSALLWRL